LFLYDNSNVVHNLELAKILKTRTKFKKKLFKNITMEKNTKKTKEIKLSLSKKEAEYLSSLVEAQVARLITLKEKDLEKKPLKEEYRVFRKIGEMLSV